MLNNPLINQSLNVSYSTLKDNAIKVHDGYIALAADYPAPTPAMPLFQTDIDALAAAITAWGPKGARGSHQQHLDLIDAAEVVRDDYRQLALYAMLTKPGDTSSWVALGFSIKNPKSKPVALEAVQNFHRFISRSIGDGLIKLKWKRPLNAKTTDVACYIVQCSATGVQPPLPDGHAIINIVDVVTKTSVIINPPFVGANYFWVTPLNSGGLGVSSAVVFYNKPAAI